MKETLVITADYLWDGIQDLPISNGALVIEGNIIKEIIRIIIINILRKINVICIDIFILATLYFSILPNIHLPSN